MEWEINKKGPLYLKEKSGRPTLYGPTYGPYNLYGPYVGPYIRSRMFQSSGVNLRLNIRSVYFVRTVDVTVDWVQQMRLFLATYTVPYTAGINYTVRILDRIMPSDSVFILVDSFDLRSLWNLLGTCLTSQYHPWGCHNMSLVIIMPSLNHYSLFSPDTQHMVCFSLVTSFPLLECLANLNQGHLHPSLTYSLYMYRKFSRYNTYKSKLFLIFQMCETRDITSFPPFRTFILECSTDLIGLQDTSGRCLSSRTHT